MGRPKAYDRNDLLDRAIEIFRVRGFHATSTAELTDELGVNRKSMYAEFGSKQGLFEAALERYDAKHLTRVLAPLEAEDATPTTIREAFHGYGEAASGWSRGRGCLMCNTAVERAALDPDSRQFTDAYLHRVRTAFRRALHNGVAAGELDARADIDRLASFFMMSLVGVSVSMRAMAEPEQVREACAVASAVLDAYVPTPA